jgi:hypothetical protein
MQLQQQMAPTWVMALMQACGWANSRCTTWRSERHKSRKILMILVQHTGYNQKHWLLQLPDKNN